MSGYIFPSTLVVEEGSSVLLQLENMRNPLKVCSLIWPDGHETDLPEHVFDQVMYWGLGYQLGQCGALIKNLSSSDEYKIWSLKATDIFANQQIATAFVAVKGNFSIKVAINEDMSKANTPYKMLNYQSF